MHFGPVLRHAHPGCLGPTHPFLWTKQLSTTIVNPAIKLLNDMEEPTGDYPVDIH